MSVYVSSGWRFVLWERGSPTAGSSCSDFVGSIPSELGDLPVIKQINFKGSSLTGEIPVELGYLSTLSYLDLTANELTGPIPGELKNLAVNARLYLNNNQFSGIGDISGHEFYLLNVQNNQLDFGDLEDANIDWTSISSQEYSPQAVIPITQTEGANNITLIINVEGLNNQYRWYNNGIPIPGESGSQLILSKNTAGIYHCEVTNPDFPDLTLESEQIEIVSELLPFERSISVGWNWFSVNVISDDMSLGNLLSCAADGDYIKNQTASATYYDGFGWYGSLQDAGGLDPKSLYKIKANNSCAADYMGMPVDVASTPIDIVSGWNWVGHLPQDPMLIQPTNDALISLTLEDNDYIKNQTESATYYPGFGWYGSLEEMRPTDGYMLKKLSPDVLIYPEVPSALASAKKRTAKERDPDVTIDPHNFEFSGSLTAKVFMDGLLVGGEDDLVLAYVNDQLRGVSGGRYFDPADAYAYPMMVYSNLAEGEELTFKFYDAEKEQLYSCDETLPFNKDMIVADAFESFELRMNSMVGFGDLTQSDGLSLNVYPNPFNDKLQIEYSVEEATKVRVAVYDMLGKVVEILDERTLNPGSYSAIWNAESYPEGSYILKLITNDASVNRKIMLIR